MGMKYFFDSYAIVEIVKKSSNYEKYSGEVVVFSLLNLIEVSYIVLLEKRIEEAQLVYDKLRPYVCEIPDDVILDAIQFRLNNRRESYSYADCIGYSYALKKGLLFLTGDDAFNGLLNVEFVK